MKNIFLTALAMTALISLAGCGGAKVTATGTETTPAAQPESVAEEGASKESPPKEIEIVEKKQVKVSLEARLKAQYIEMGLPESIASLLSETRVEFLIPEQFDAVAPIENSLWDYDYALKAKSGKVEVRFKVLPGENVATEQNGGNVSTANELMNVIIRLNGAALVSNMQEHPKSEASSRFNASSYTTGTFQPVPDFSDMLIASAGLIYREGHGRVIVVTLMDSLDDPVTRTEWITGANAIRFAEEEEEE